MSSDSKEISVNRTLCRVRLSYMLREQYIMIESIRRKSIISESFEGENKFSK